MRTLTRLCDLIGREPVVVRHAIGPLVALLGNTWARQGATPARDVVAVVEPDGTTVAGPAAAESDGTLVHVEPRHLA